MRRWRQKWPKNNPTVATKKPSQVFCRNLFNIKSGMFQKYQISKLQVYCYTAPFQSKMFFYLNLASPRATQLSCFCLRAVTLNKFRFGRFSVVPHTSYTQVQKKHLCLNPCPLALQVIHVTTDINSCKFTDPGIRKSQFLTDIKISFGR